MNETPDSKSARPKNIPLKPKSTSQNQTSEILRTI